MLTLLAMAGLASTSVAQTQKRVRPRPDVNARATPPPPCQATWPTSLNGIPSYYSLVVQLQNCQAADIPLSIDMDADQGQGTSLSGVAGVDVKGSAVVWDAGTSSGTVNLDAPPVLTIPHGDGQGGVGQLVGFTTVPYWDGNCGGSPGPYANQNSNAGTNDPSCTQNTGPPSIRGSWALYLPSATFEFDLVQALPFPYVPQYNDDGTPPQTPGAVFTGLLVTRNRPGGLQDPIFTKSSAQGYGKSPDATTFVPGNCYDPVSLVNGANGGYLTPSNWSFLGLDDAMPTPHTWYFTPAGNDFAPLLAPPDGPYPFPVLMLVTGFEDTHGGTTNDMALRDTENSVTSTTPHYLQIAILNVDDVDCSGSDKVFDIPVAIGADLRGEVLTSAQLPGAVLANSDLTTARMNQTSFVAGTGDTQPNLSYADLSGNSAAGADFEAALLIGADMRNMNLIETGLKNTNLLLANLDGSTIDNPGTNFGGAQFCHTTMPNGSVNNTDCNTLLVPQAPWQVETAECDPLTCVFVSLYNNTTRTLAQGLDWCVDGQFVPPQAPTWIAPLVTGQYGLGPASSSASTSTNIKCGITFANGAAGKIRVTVDTSSGSVVTTVDSGTCFGGSVAACLPRAFDGVTPVNISTHQYVNNNATFLDVIMCEPEAFTGGACPTTAALPGLLPKA
jgi:hypothetical protein